MKVFRFLFVFIFVLSFSLGVVNSASIEMDENFNLGDNGVIKISANFYEPLKISDIEFYRRHMSTSFENVETVKVGNEQFITFKVPLNKIPDNYSINTTVKEEILEEIQENDISSSFSVSNHTSSFYLNESFKLVSEGYLIFIQNLLGESLEISINPESEEESSGSFLENLFGKNSVSESESVSLGPYEKKGIEFEIGNESKLVKIEFASGNESQIVLVYENVVINSEGEVEVVEPENSSNETENNESVEDEEVYIEEKNESSDFEDEDSSGKDDPKENSGNESESPVEENESTSSSKLETCSDMAGKICNPNNESCEGIKKDAKDGICCIGNCVEKEESVAGKWVGWVLLLLVLGSIGYAFLKNKGKKGKGIDFGKDKK